MNIRLNQLLIALIFFILYPVMFELIPDYWIGIFPIRLEAILLPLSLLFGWSAIIGISLSTIAINLYLYVFKLEEGLSLSFIPLEFFAFLISLGLAYLFIKKFKKKDIYWFISTWIIHIILLLSLGTYWFLIYQNINFFWILFIMIFINVNVIGYIIIEIVNRNEKLHKWVEKIA